MVDTMLCNINEFCEFELVLQLYKIHTEYARNAKVTLFLEIFWSTFNFNTTQNNSEFDEICNCQFISKEFLALS